MGIKWQNSPYTHVKIILRPHIRAYGKTWLLGYRMEKQIEKHLVARVKAMGGMAVKFPPLFLAGFPDRIVLLPGGRVVFVELKAPGERPRALQEQVHGKLRRLGFRVEVLDGREAVDNFLRSI